MALNPNWLAMPVALPLICAALGLAFSRWSWQANVRFQRNLAITAVVANLGVCLLLLRFTLQGERLVYQMGLWPAPFGITFVADGLSAIILTVTAVLLLAVVPFSMGTLDERVRMNFYPLLLFLLMGVNGAFLAGDLFNLYVFFEVLLMASFVLLTLGGQPMQVNAGIRYVVLNLLASVLFLATAGVAYGTLGTLNMAHMAQRMASAPPFVEALLAGLLLVAFGSKAGLFPLFFWLPTAYHTPHPAVTSLFGGLLTKVGVYTLFRTFPLLFPTYLSEWQNLLLVIAGCTMLIGVLGVAAQPTLRRKLSFHVISQVGYMIMGLGLTASSTQLAVGMGLAAGIYYLVHNMLVKTALLMASGIVELESGTGNAGRIGGLIRQQPMLALLFFFAASALAGFPPFSGFVAKLGLLQTALATDHLLIAGASVLTSLLTLVNVMQMWQLSFWGPPRPQVVSTRVLANTRNRWLVLAPIGLLMALSLWIGLNSQQTYEATRLAAEQALDREGYILAVQPVDMAAALEAVQVAAEEKP